MLSLFSDWITQSPFTRYTNFLRAFTSFETGVANGVFQVFGIVPDANLLDVASRISKSPTGLTSDNTSPKVSNAGWNLTVVKFQKGAKSLQNLPVITFCGAQDLSHLLNALLIHLVTKDGIQINPLFHAATPPFFENNSNLLLYRRRNQQELEVAFKKLKSPDPGVILVILPAKDVALYAEVKRWGDCVQGVLIA